MCQHRKSLRFHNQRSRRGLTLVELLAATVIMVMLAGAMGALALTVETGNEYSQGRIEAAQHARVVIDRIRQTLNSAHASADFPGFAVFEQTNGSWTFSDTLVVWHPTGKPANPEGLPTWSELVIYCPDSSSPNRLLELTISDDYRAVPSLSDVNAWEHELDKFRNFEQVQSYESIKGTELTNLVRTAATNKLRGGDLAAIRFEVVVRPSDVDWQAYRTETLAWQDLPWVQDIYGSKTGLRQSWCRFEIQLMPGHDAKQKDPSGETAIPFFGSAALYYELHK